MQKKFLEYLFTTSNIQKKESALITCSGGTDSMCLFDLLVKTQKSHKLHLGAAHVNYNLREESSNDQKRVETFCAQNNIPLFTLTMCPLKKDENTLRKIRYNFFNTIKKEHNIKYILTAHNANDHTETVLLNIIRGAGLSGLAGVTETTTLKRPLLWASKEEIMQYLQTNNIPHGFDESNTQDIYTRNKLRNKIIPLITEINPNLNTTIKRLSNNAQSSNAIINNLVKTKISITEKNNTITFNKNEFNKLQTELKKHVINNALKSLHITKNITQKTTQKILKTINTNQPKNGLEMSKGLRLTINHDTITLHR